MTEKKNKLINLKGANSTMKLGLVLYAAIVVALIVGACHAYAAGDPISTVNKLSEFIFSLIRAIGLILLGLGIMQVGLSLKSHDPMYFIVFFRLIVKIGDESTHLFSS